MKILNMKIPFFGKEEKQQNPADIAKIVPVINKDLKIQNVSTSYVEDFRTFIKNLTPESLDKKLYKTRPFIITSFFAWPAYWMYKGLEWSKRRNTDNIECFIHRTFQKAKVMQIAIVSLGLMTALYEPRKQSEESKKEQDKKAKGKDNKKEKEKAKKGKDKEKEKEKEKKGKKKNRKNDDDD